MLCLRPAIEVETFLPQLKGGDASLTNRNPPTSGKAAYASLARLSVVVTMCIRAIVGQHCFKHVDQPELAGLSVSAGCRIVPQRRKSS